MNRLLFAKAGRARYISHLDLMRTFQRAFQRAGLTIRHTEGFNPHPFVSILLPLSVGFSSACELLEFELLDGVDPAAVPDRLNAVLPEGVQVLRCFEGGRKAKELAFVTYEMTLEYDNGVPGGTEEAIRALLGREKLEVTKQSKKGESAVDVIPLIRDFSLSDGEEGLLLTATLCAQNPGLNPQLLMAALTAADPAVTPDFVAYHRAAVLDKEGKVFL